VVLIDPFTPGNVVDLVFIQNTALVKIKEVTRRVRTRRIIHTRFNFSHSGTVQEKAPVLVLLTWIQIFKKIFQGFAGKWPFLFDGTK
jgi:hypothetical protein